MRVKKKASNGVPVKGLSKMDVADVSSALSYMMSMARDEGHKYFTWWGADEAARRAKIKLDIIEPLKRLENCIEAFEEGVRVKLPKVEKKKVVDNPGKGV